MLAGPGPPIGRQVPATLTEDANMETLSAFHEVDDVDHRPSSPKREDFLEPFGGKVRTSKDPAGSNRVGLIFEVPSRAALEEALQVEEAAEAMKFDGVHPEMILILEEG